ncbi:hypothetical protein B0J17DRAFT_664449 [Rhizoctonia solani]|nr:hypothetical protein B0J17DRAFT_664449 [Rhizoctonia solani]
MRIQAARFEIRHLPGVRKLLRIMIDMRPEDELPKGHIQLELKLRGFGRIRNLYRYYLTHDPRLHAHIGQVRRI